MKLRFVNPDESGTGDTTTWAYDEASGLLTAKTYADGHGPTYTYTADGKLATRTWARGVVTTYAYDGWGNLATVTYSDGTPTVTYTYDAMGRQTSATDAAGTTTFAYDDYGAAISETWGEFNNRVLLRHYDAYGRNAGYSVAGTRKATLGYDAATGRMATMDAGGQFTWSYLTGSDLKSALDYPNGARTEYAYEPSRDLLANVRNAKGGTAYSNYAYVNDALGRRTAKNNEQYGYNVRSELTAASGNGNYAYLYDDIGNRVTSTECGTNSLYTANNLNQYTQITNVNLDLQPQPFTPQYDLDGNQTLVKTATGIWSVTYNGENRPIRWECGDTVITMDFDRMGRRTYYREMNGNSQVTFTRFLYDGYVMIQQLFSNSPYNVYKEFVWDPTEAVATKTLCFRQYGQADAYLMHDGNKNVTDVVAAAASAESLAHYEYAPFGAVTSATGSRASSNPYRFSSEFSDDTLGLVYYNYRHYEPTMGRWLTRDPIGESGGNNLLRFCRNSALSFCDYRGLFDKDKCRELNKQIQKLADLLKKELAKYDPVLDGQGGSYFKHGSKSGTTKPGGHYEKIKNYQRGLKNNLERWKDVCSNGPDECPPIVYPTWADELSNRNISKPISTDSPSAYDQNQEGANTGFWAAAGAAAGAGVMTAIIVGSAGPQAFLPEEIVTVPVGAFSGFVVVGFQYIFSENLR